MKDIKDTSLPASIKPVRPFFLSFFSYVDVFIGEVSCEFIFCDLKIGHALRELVENRC